MVWYWASALGVYIPPHIGYVQLAEQRKTVVLITSRSDHDINMHMQRRVRGIVALRTRDETRAVGRAMVTASMGLRKQQPHRIFESHDA